MCLPEAVAAACLSLVLLATPALQAQTVSVDHQSLTFTTQVGGAPFSLPVNVTSVPAGEVILATVVEQTDHHQLEFTEVSGSRYLFNYNEEIGG
jgi:hypothetical protein